MGAPAHLQPPHGRELAAALSWVKEEAATLSTYLGEEEPHYHSSPAEGMGEGKVDGYTRALLVREAEVMRAKALDKVLEEHPDRKAAPWCQLCSVRTDYLAVLKNIPMDTLGWIQALYFFS